MLSFPQMNNYQFQYQKAKRIYIFFIIFHLDELQINLIYILN